MTSPGEVFDEHQPDNAEAWYDLGKIDPNDREARRILMSDGEDCNVCMSDDRNTWEWERDPQIGVFWRELCPLPDVRSDVERERDELKVKLRQLDMLVRRDDITVIQDIRAILGVVWVSRIGSSVF